MANNATERPEGRGHDRLVDGVHGSVTIDVEVMSQQSLETYYHLNARSAGLSIRYRGHKDDLLAAGV